MKTNKLKVIYNKPIEEINEKLKSNILEALSHCIEKSEISSLILTNIFGGAILGLLCSVLFIILILVGSECGVKLWGIIEHNQCLYHIIIISIGIAISLFICIRDIRKMKNNVKEIILLSKKLSYEEFFEEFNNRKNLFAECLKTDLIRNYCNYKNLQIALPSLISIENSMSYLYVKYTTVNGDIQTEQIFINNEIYNVNITEPELKVDYDYEMTLILPYKE